MIGKALLTCGISAAVVSLATFLGAFTSNIFEETASIFEQINNGQTVTVEKVISDADINRLKNISSEVQQIQEETK